MNEAGSLLPNQLIAQDDEQSVGETEQSSRERGKKGLQQSVRKKNRKENKWMKEKEKGKGFSSQDWIAGTVEKERDGLAVLTEKLAIRRSRMGFPKKRK